MGYMARAYRRRRQRRNVRLIAHAALAGAVIVRGQVIEYVGSSAVEAGLVNWVRRWTVHYDDAQVSHHYRSRGEASARYLVWWFNKQGMHPWVTWPEHIVDDGSDATCG